MSAVVERTKVVLQDGGKGRDDYSVLVSVLLECLPEFNPQVCARSPFGLIGVV